MPNAPIAISPSPNGALARHASIPGQLAGPGDDVEARTAGYSHKATRISDSQVFYMTGPDAVEWARSPGIYTVVRL